MSRIKFENSDRVFDVSAIKWCDMRHVYYADSKKCLCGALERHGQLCSGETELAKSDEMDFLLNCIKGAVLGSKDHCEICGECGFGDGGTLPLHFAIHGRCARKIKNLLWHMDTEQQRELFRQSHIKQGLCIYNTNGWQADSICEEPAKSYNLCEKHIGALQSPD